MAPADVRQRGFTLIEVVVAIAIVALGMMAVFRVVHDTVNNSTYLRDRTFATWIADNRLAEIRLATGLPSVDETEGEVEFAGQKWRWQATVSQTPVDDLRRIDVRVRRADEGPDTSLAEVSGFAGAVGMDSPPSATPWTRTGQPPDGEDGGGQADRAGSAPARTRDGSQDEEE